MAQHDYVIDNADGATVRADINSALAAAVSLNSGSSAPSTTFAYQLWADTGNDLLKMRDGTNTSWIVIGVLDDNLIDGQTEDTSPDGDADFVLTYDTSASGFKKVLLRRVAPKQPTRQVLTSGSAATYTPPTNCRFIRVTLKGGGGGSGGNGTASQTAGGDGGDTSFNSVVAKGGKGSSPSNDGAGGLGGSGGSNNSLTVSRRAGAPGGNATNQIWTSSNFIAVGGHGGGAGGANSVASGTGGAAGAGGANSGGGASGAGVGSGSQSTISGFHISGGGGEGEEAVLWLPATTYTYTIGAGGSAGNAGTSGLAGAAGGTGRIDVEEFY
jgi:hypothetical protein